MGSSIWNLHTPMDKNQWCGNMSWTNVKNSRNQLPVGYKIPTEITLEDFKNNCCRGCQCHIRDGDEIVVAKITALTRNWVVLLLWSSCTVTLEYPRRYSNRVTVQGQHGNSKRYFKGATLLLLCRCKCSNCVIGYRIVGHSNLAVKVGLVFINPYSLSMYYV